MVVADTRLNKENKTEDFKLILSNWKVIERFDSNDGISHMGLIMLQSLISHNQNIVRNISEKTFFKVEKGKKLDYIQVMTASFLKYHITCAFVYIRHTPTEAETMKLGKFLKSFDLVMGDLNLDSYRSADVPKLQILCETRRKVLNEITTIRFNQLDHILLDCNLFPNFFATSFRNHTTDHYTAVVRIPSVGNTISELFLSSINFNQEHWTKTAKRKRKF